MSLLYLLFKDKAIYNPANILISGDSTMADAGRTKSIADSFFTYNEMTSGWSAFSIATNGHTINQQKATWQSYSNKSNIDYIFVQIGLNDCVNENNTNSAVISMYQEYINAINSSKKQSAKIIASCMSPCKLRWDLFQNPILCQQIWVALNNAIMDGTITGVDFRLNSHVAILDDGLSQLEPGYDSGDHIHENEFGAQVIRNSFRSVLNLEPFIISEPASSHDLIFTNTVIKGLNKIWYPKYGTEGYGNLGIDTNKMLVANAAGRIYFKYLKNDKYGVLGFNNIPSGITYPSMIAGIFLGGSIYAAGGSTGNYHSIKEATENYYYGVLRESSGVISVQESSDAINWQTIFTFGNTTTEVLYPVVDIAGSFTPGKISFPKTNY